MARELSVVAPDRVLEGLLRAQSCGAMAYAHVSTLVARALAFVYLSAFLSAAWLGQWKALAGPRGTMPKGFRAWSRAGVVGSE